jgi:SulP family sulfate permease
MTRVTDITGNKKMIGTRLPDRWAVLKINGPLFFAAADRAFGEVSGYMASLDGVVLYMGGVTLLDSGDVSALNKLTAYCAKEGKKIVIADLQFQPLKTLSRANVKPVTGVISFYPTLNEAIHSFDDDRR